MAGAMSSRLNKEDFDMNNQSGSRIMETQQMHKGKSHIHQPTKVQITKNI